MKTVKPLWVYVVQAAIRPAMKCAIAALLLWSLWLASGLATPERTGRLYVFLWFIALASTLFFLSAFLYISVGKDLYRRAQEKQQDDLRRKENQR